MLSVREHLKGRGRAYDVIRVREVRAGHVSEAAASGGFKLRDFIENYCSVNTKTFMASPPIARAMVLPTSANDAIGWGRHVVWRAGFDYTVKAYEDWDIVRRPPPPAPPDQKSMTFLVWRAAMVKWNQDHFSAYANDFEDQPARKLRGCREGGPKNQKAALPQWAGTQSTMEASIRKIEGVLPRNTKAHDGKGVENVASSKITFEDFHMNHFKHDWNIFLRPDPHYRSLLTDSMANFHDWGFDAMENEWDSRDLPLAHIPFAGDRVVLFGHHIFDCGHPPYKTEIHPPFGIVSMRNSGVRPDWPGDTYEPASPAHGPFVPCTYGDCFFNRGGGMAWNPPGSVAGYYGSALDDAAGGAAVGGAVGGAAGAVTGAAIGFGVGLFKKTCNYASGSSTRIPRNLATAREYSFDVYPPFRRPFTGAKLTFGHVRATALLAANHLTIQGVPSADPLFYRVTVHGERFDKHDQISFGFFCYWDGDPPTGTTIPELPQVRRYAVRLKKFEVRAKHDWGWENDGEYRVWVGAAGTWIDLLSVQPGLNDTGRQTWTLGVDLIATVLGDDPLRISVSGFEADPCEDDDIGTKDKDWTESQLRAAGIRDVGDSEDLPPLETPSWRLHYSVKRLYP